MAIISLRSYNKEIEHLIDQGQVDEAIGHCMHILQSVPKHLGTYRLLGKALLESKRFSDATDIFQRVLSSVPDDFVSNVGMSIIRENEKNLDMAIWHMERAFESQPANAVVQEELRRLYGKRDGAEPPKIRLTRGALARMYVRGHLYRQAIGELRAALVEDPQRPDLQVLLAEMYYQNGQKVEAVDTCSTLLKKYPFCLEANRILATILPETERKDDAVVYRQRVISLDPYYGKLAEGQTSSDQVPDQAITLEKLSYQAGQNLMQSTTQPDWAASLGAAFEPAKVTDELPDWLSTPEGSESQVSEDTGPAAVSVPVLDEMHHEEVKEEDLPDWFNQAPTPVEPSAVHQSEENIPDFLKDAGWGPSSGEFDEEAVSRELQTEETPTEDIVKAEIPDWLQQMAPQEVSQEAQDENATPGDVPPWLQDTPPGSTDTIISWLKAIPVDKGKEIAEGEEPPVEETQKLAEDEVQLPGWLSEQDQQPTGVTGTLPSWLPESEKPVIAGNEAAITSDTNAEIPDWLQGIEKDIIPPTVQEEALTPEVPPEESVQEGPAEDWTGDYAQPAAISEEIEPEAPVQDELTEWLKSLDEGSELEETPAEEPPLTWEAAVAEVTRIDEGPGDAIPAEELPDWLERVKSEQDLTQVEPIAEEFSSSQVPTDAEISLEEFPEPVEQPSEEPVSAEIPDWLRDIEGIKPAEAELAFEETPTWLEETTPPVTEPASEIPLPDWLPEPETTSIPLAEGTAPVPDDLEDTKPRVIKLQPETVQEPTLQAEAPSTEAAFNLEDPDAALAWLESLAAQQGIPQDQLTTSPDERPQTPDWLEQAGQEAEARGELSTYVPTETTQTPQTELEPFTLDAESPTLLTPIKSSLEENLEPESMVEEKIPDWLTEIETAPVTVDETAPVLEEPVEVLEPMLSEEPVETPVEVSGIEEIPSWLEEPAAVQQPFEEELEVSDQLSQETTVESAFDLEDPDAALAWLESLAAQQGTPQDQLTTEPSERPSTPQWLEEAGQQAEARGELSTYIPTETTQGFQLPVEHLEPFEEETVPETIEQQPTIEPDLVEEIPDWLRSMEEASETAKVSPSEAENIELAPDWLQDFEMPGEPVEAQELPPAIAEEPVVEEELPSWLQGEEAEEEPLPSAITEPPTWISEEQPGEELPWTVEPTEVEEPETTPDWLRQPHKLDLNTASLRDLENLPGMGFILAQTIMAYRETNGPFTEVEELIAVPGMDEPLLDQIKDLLEVTTSEPRKPTLADRIVEPKDDDEKLLMEARRKMVDKDYAQAADQFLGLMKRHLYLPEILRDLKETLNTEPENIYLWQALGDAYMHNDQLQEALDAYSKAEQLLR